MTFHQFLESVMALRSQTVRATGLEMGDMTFRVSRNLLYAWFTELAGRGFSPYAESWCAGFFEYPMPFGVLRIEATP